MSIFYVPVTEVVTIDCVYTVEADSPEEAIRIAQIGDTICEERESESEVINRIVEYDPDCITRGNNTEDARRAHRRLLAEHGVWDTGDTE